MLSFILENNKGSETHLTIHKCRPDAATFRCLGYPSQRATSISEALGFGDHEQRGLMLSRIFLYVMAFLMNACLIYNCL